MILATSTAAEALSAAERETLERFESSFGLRRVSGYIYPSAEYGLSDAQYAGRMTGIVGRLTSEGRKLFPYLVETIPFASEAYGYLATPCRDSPGSFNVLVSGPDGAALVGTYRRPDGRQELVITADSNPGTIHSELLFHGILNWATRGVFLGTQRYYLTVHIDDVFAANPRSTSPFSKSEPASQPIRMDATDATRALEWMAGNDFRMDLLFNGHGASGSDELTRVLLDSRAAFGWLNHTWSHENLDDADASLIVSEIQRNIAWAEGQGLPIDRSALVTGAHSGLANPNIVQALNELGVSWIGADNSHHSSQVAIGRALTVPRWPTNAYFNVGRRSEQLEAYNASYVRTDGNAEATTGRASPATWDAYVESESSIIFRHLMSNDPRPHFFHQSNLAEDGIFYDLVDPAVKHYRAHVNAPLVQLAFADIGAVLLKQRRWTQAVARGQVRAYLCDGKVTVKSSVATEVPVTGTVEGSEYGGQNSGWIEVAAGRTSIDLAATPSSRQH